MIVLFYLILLVEIITILYNIIKYFVFIFKRNNSCNNSHFQQYDFQINVLIPCYKEIKVIKNTLEHFKRITENLNNISIYVITTDKEKNDNLPQTTYEYLSSLDFFNISNFHIINYPQVHGIMANQLNYGIDLILNKSSLSTQKNYFSIYNADSNPDDSTFIELSQKIINNNFPKILQQYSNYFLNYDNQSFITKGFAIYQTAFEFRNGIINNNISKYLYSHVVGHGLTIRGDYVTHLNGFNTNFWCEDIYLTGLLHNNEEKIIPLISLDNAENPEKFKIQIIQNAVWYKTASHPFKIFKDILKTYKFSMSGVLWLYHELRASTLWLLAPLFLIFTLVYPIIMHNCYLLLFSILIYCLYVYVNYTLNLLVISKKRFLKYNKNFFSLCLGILLSGIGPLFSIFLKEKKKTER